MHHPALHDLQPYAADLAPPTPDDPRLGHLLRSRPHDPRALDGARVALIGFPSDAGVRRNLGRPGAAQGPAALRRWLYRMTPDPRAPAPFTALLADTIDLGDVPCGDDLEAAQSLLADVVARTCAAGALPVILGGGHEVALGHFWGHVRAGEPVRLLNIDAHLDVRPLRAGLGHSGSPFRQALEDPSGMARGYIALGLEPATCAPAHAAWALARGATLSFWPDADAVGTRHALRDALSTGGPLMAGVDIDAVSAAHAPGVSAPRASGLPPALLCDLAQALGHSPLVVGLHIAELSPPHDLDGRTARLCALTVWRFLQGVAARPALLTPR